MTAHSAAAPADGDPLAALRDLHLPPPPAGVLVDDGSGLTLLPVLLALLLAASLAALAVFVHRRCHRLRCAALKDARGIAADWQQHRDGARLAAELSILLRRVVRQCAPAAAVLHGEAWLRHLDAAIGGDAFARGPGRLLADAPFRPSTDAPQAAECEALVALVLNWLRHLPADSARPGGRLQ